MRVMLVDDSAVIRRIVSRVLDSEAGIHLVGTATNGEQAIRMIDACRPDVMVLDMEMPVLDGLATLRALRPRWPELPVIMFSTLTGANATAATDALALGANDYAEKPVSQGGLDATMAAVRDSLVPLIRSWSRGDTRRHRAATPPGDPRAARATTDPAPSMRDHAPQRCVEVPVEGRDAGGRPDAVVIGSSAGGPNALSELIPRFPADLPVPLLLTQHMPKTFTKLLAERLDTKSRLTVTEAEDGMEARPGHLYIARGGVHLVPVRSGDRILLGFDYGPPENFCRPAVDVMFRAAARVWGPSVLAVILTGMGRDGVEGARAIRERGGTVLTQDQETSLVWGMPGAVVEAGLSSATLPLDSILGAVLDRVGTPPVAPVPVPTRPELRYEMSMTVSH